MQKHNKFMVGTYRKLEGLMQRKVDDFEVADVATKMGLQIQQISFCFGEMPM